MLSVAVMAHPSRREFVDELLPQLDGAQVVWDEHGDRWDTGRRSLQAFDPAAAHHCVVQDDALLCSDFLAAAELVAEVAGDRPVGLYVGKVRPHQYTITPAVRRAIRAGVPWIAGPGPYWGVAIILPTSHIPELVAWGDQQPQIANYDRRIQVFYGRQGIDCWYTIPSLAEHRPVAQNPSLINGRTGNRQAHDFMGDRSTLAFDWSLSPIPIPGGRMAPEATHTLLTSQTFRPVAARDLIGYDHHGVRRRVRAGRPVPIGLRVNPEDVVDGGGPSRTEPTPAPDHTPAADSVTVTPGMRSNWSPSDPVRKLTTEAARRGLTVKGTGANGGVVKDDLIAALKADDA